MSTKPKETAMHAGELPKPGTMGLATGSGAAGIDVAWSEEAFGLALLEEEENLVPASRAPG